MRLDLAVRPIDTDLIALELPSFPVTRTASSVSHGEDLNGHVGDPVNYGVGKTPEKKFSRTMQMPRPTLRIAVNFTDGVIERCYESMGGGRIALCVPEKSGSRFGHRVRMEVNAWTSHRTARRSGAVPRTKELSLLFPYPNRQCVAQSPCPTPTQHLHPRSHLNFQSDDRPARRGLPRADAELLPQPFCDWTSWKEFYNNPSTQHKFQFLEAVWLTN